MRACRALGLLIDLKLHGVHMVIGTCHVVHVGMSMHLCDALTLRLMHPLPSVSFKLVPFGIIWCLFTTPSRKRNYYILN